MAVNGAGSLADLTDVGDVLFDDEKGALSHGEISRRRAVVIREQHVSAMLDKVRACEQVTLTWLSRCGLQ